MITMRKAMQILSEPDYEKRKALIDALPEKDVEALLNKELPALQKEIGKLHDEIAKSRGGK